MAQQGYEKGNAPGSALVLRTNEDGEAQYDAIIRQGYAASHTVHAQFKDLIPLRDRADFQRKDTHGLLERPDQDTVQSTAERTRLALEKITQRKVVAAQPKTGQLGTNRQPEYVRYTPKQQGPGYNSGAKQRVVRMVDMPVDPFEPQRFKTKKIPRGPPSPPAPVMHSPPRKPTAEEQKEWFIPPSISNWKNAKGFTIPLDKRLAADARGLQEVQVNDNFAKFADALNAAERHARDGVRQRALQQQKLAQKEKDAKEQHLRLLAQQAREARAGLDSGASHPGRGPTEGNGTSATQDRSSSGDIKQSYEEREALRRERQQELEREVRLSHAGTEQRAKMLARAQGRDLSEKIALGLAKPTTSRESMFDQRLFNMSEGLDSGFKGDDTYNIYDKPLFTGSSSSSVYRPSRNADSDAYGGGSAENITGMLQQERFEGTSSRFQGTTEGAAPPTRDGPVQFEKSTTATVTTSKPSADLFGLDQFLERAKKSKRDLPEDSAGHFSSKRTC
ncbi:mRNA splicing protein [Dispira simplex]|nr:mRNA splicing protein [Dispira simplex]